MKMTNYLISSYAIEIEIQQLIRKIANLIQNDVKDKSLDKYFITRTAHCP